MSTWAEQQRLYSLNDLLSNRAEEGEQSVSDTLAKKYLQDWAETFHWTITERDRDEGQNITWLERQF